jgi:Tfp pilus assembly protein PilX
MTKKFVPKLNEDGFSMVLVLTFILIAGIISVATVNAIINNLSLASNNNQSQQAFNVAEAGINYYLWHLNVNPNDYKDGQSTPSTPNPTLGYGPYVHNYIDSSGNTIGTYTLWISPTGGGSTVVTVRSIGQINGSSVTRTVDAKLGVPSFASYAVASDTALWFGSTESADGPVQSNQGIEMDGPNDAEISSTNATYVPPDGLHSTNYPNGESHPGVWCDISVVTPANCNTRDKSQWVSPVPSIDFNQVTTSLCTMKKTAFGDNSATSSLANLSNACSQVPATRTNAYIPETSSSSSATKGYLIILNNNQTYDLYKVNSENDTLSPYTSALNKTLIATQISLPPSGVIFVEDNVWVLSAVGSSFDGRVTIASGRLATDSNTSIVIAGPIIYSNKNGTDALGLVAYDSVFIAPYAPASSPGYITTSSPFNFEVDGALLAENGEVMYGETGDSSNFYTYRSNPNLCLQGWTQSNQTMTLYGSVATRQLWTWSIDYGGSNCSRNVLATTGASAGDYISGFYNDDTEYDYNLQYSPPPSYPLTSTFNILSWREVLTSP